MPRELMATRSVACRPARLLTFRPLHFLAVHQTRDYRRHASGQSCTRYPSDFGARIDQDWSHVI